jgi:hypothetical protein
VEWKEKVPDTCHRFKQFHMLWTGACVYVVYLDRRNQWYISKVDLATKKREFTTKVESLQTGKIAVELMNT